MSHNPRSEMFILEYITDGWVRPESFGEDFPEDQGNSYAAVSNDQHGNAASYGYTTSHVYPTWVTDHCPNAPDANWDEMKSLMSTEGAVNETWMEIQ